MNNKLENYEIKDEWGKLRKKAILDAQKLDVLTYQQELTVVQKILETRNLETVTNALSMPYKSVLQVATKYIDVIALIIQNTEVNEIIDRSYGKTIKKALKANEQAIDLLARQIELLWKEYNAPENSAVLMKDYIVDQILKIQETLQKHIDKNDINYKANREYLFKQLSHVDKNTLGDVTANDYAESTEAVFAKLKARDDELKKASIAKMKKSEHIHSTWHFDLYGDEGKTFIGHYDSCRALQEAFPDKFSSQALSEAFVKRKKAGTKEPFLYHQVYMIKNYYKGQEYNGIENKET